MKPLFWTLGIILLLSACSTPGVSDFTDEQKPLNEDEFMTIWRLARQPAISESMDTTDAHFGRWEKEVEPLFAQLMPAMLADIKAGKLTVHEYKSIEDMSEYPIEDFGTHITQFHGTSWQNIAPLMQVIQMDQRRKSSKKGLAAQEFKWEIIYKDPEGKKPEIRVGFIFFDDLKKRDYQIEVDGKSYDLVSYFDKVSDFSFPIYLGDQTRSIGLLSLDEAFKVKKLILNGRWNEIIFKEGRPTHEGIMLNQ